MTHTETGVDAAVSIEYDATDTLTLSAEDRDATMYVTRPELSPLSSAETHATLKIATDDGTVEVGLNGETLDSVLDALRHIQEHHAGGD
jgi:hypothetical protein